MFKRFAQLVTVGLLCLLVGIAFGRSGERAQITALDQRTTINSIPKEYGRLAAGYTSSLGEALYFEAPDGTIRIVLVRRGLDYGSLSFSAITVPRN